MRVVIIGLIFAAVILAGGTAYLLRSYLTSQEAEFAAMVPKAPTTEVMVAGADMPPGTVINGIPREDFGGGHPDPNQDDGIHPTAQGYDIVVQNVWKVLKPML